MTIENFDDAVPPPDTYGYDEPSADDDQADELRHELLTGAVPGDVWALDLPDGIPAVWGAGDEVLWAEGETLVIAAPQGTGKTTLAGQLIAARLGLLDDVLGFPVAPSTSRVLWLAMDRPRQIQRSFARLVEPEHRAVLHARLVVRPGPPSRDLARHPEALATMAGLAGADTVALDSLKDAAVGLADDEVGAGLNQAMQIALAAGVQVLALHHPRKSQGGDKPKTLDDLYGSTWITAGAGSVVLLWGKPGDTEVELSHLKQPGEPIGPLKVEHDHYAGTSRVVVGFDLYRYLAGQPRPVTTEQVARVRYSREPTQAEIRRTHGWLKRRADAGKVHQSEGERPARGGTPPALWSAVDDRRDEPR